MGLICIRINSIYRLCSLMIGIVMPGLTGLLILILDLMCNYKYEVFVPHLRLRLIKFNVLVVPFFGSELTNRNCCATS